MLIAYRDKSEIQNLKTICKTEFEMKDLGATKGILGIEIVRDRKNGHSNNVPNSLLEEGGGGFWYKG